MHLEEIYNKDFIIDFISGKSVEEDKVFKSAKSLKETYYGDKVIIRGLLEISNYCKNECLYCGINVKNANVKRYRMRADEIFYAIKLAYYDDYRSFVLQGGDDPYYSDELLVRLLDRLKSNFNDIAITLSLGERSYASYKKLREAGADRYLLRHETVNQDLYAMLHPRQSLANRIECLYNLKALGYQVGTGFMVGLPTQTYQDLSDDLAFIAELEPEMVGIGPFIPHKDTALKDCQKGDVDEIIRLLVLLRNILPKTLIPATTALGTASSKKQRTALQYSANVVMPNITPSVYKKDYQLYDNKHSKTVAELIESGIKISKERGDHYDFRKKLY